MHRGRNAYIDHGNKPTPVPVSLEESALIVCVNQILSFQVYSGTVRKGFTIKFLIICESGLQVSSNCISLVSNVAISTFHRKRMCTGFHLTKI